MNPCFIVLLFFSSQGFGMSVQGTQGPAQDLSDTVQVTHFLDLSNRFFQDFESDSSLVYAAQALALSKYLLDSQGVESDGPLFNRIKALTVESYVLYARALRESDIQAAEDSLKAGLLLLQEMDISERAVIYSELGNTYERMGQNDKALHYHRIALELFQTSGNQYGYLNQLINMGLVLRGIGNYGDSLEYFMEALKTGQELNDRTAIVESLLAMGFVYAFVEKWDEALKSQREALEIYQEINDLWGIARIHNDMGVTYNLAGKLDSALVHHRAALALRLESNDMYNTFASYLYIGDILAKQEYIPEAIESYEKGLPYGNQSGYKIVVVDAYLRLGDYYLLLPEAENAQEKFEIALQLSGEIGTPMGESRANMGLARIAMLRGEYDQAIARLKLAEKTTPESSLQIRKEMYKDIAEVYFYLGDYRNAYQNSLLYSDMKDSVLVAENRSKITRLTNVMNFENEMALNRESNEKIMAIKQVEIKRERLRRNIFLAGMIFAIVLVVITFVRFIEKNKLSNKLNETLRNLNATQSQLVQQEKLASLGQLTAGIAHEIKNPLNFVNNFSEVSIEMVDEVREEVNSEIKKGNVAGGKNGTAEPGDHALFGKDGNPETILSILDDIEANLKTIHKHGTRADAIVKSMLQHSRGGSGKMEPANLNALVKEYVNLAFHGMRAGKEPINVDIDLQLDESVGDVPLIAEDFSRVILNLCKNGFDAMSEKLKVESDELKVYSPKLTVRTGRVAGGGAGNGGADNGVAQNGGAQNGGILIEIEDNGPGIPDDIKDKILQPFFTTKKGTAGTGLGLSITHDIIKAHGGELSVNTIAGQGTTFRIGLHPNNT